MIQSTDDRIKCRVNNMQLYETGSAPPVVVGGVLLAYVALASCIPMMLPHAKMRVRACVRACVRVCVRPFALCKQALVDVLARLKLMVMILENMKT